MSTDGICVNGEEIADETPKEGCPPSGGGREEAVRYSAERPVGRRLQTSPEGLKLVHGGWGARAFTLNSGDVWQIYG